MTLHDAFPEVAQRLDELEGLIPEVKPDWFYKIDHDASKEFHALIAAVRTELAEALDGMVLVPEGTPIQPYHEARVRRNNMATLDFNLSVLEQSGLTYQLKEGRAFFASNFPARSVTFEPYNNCWFYRGKRYKGNAIAFLKWFREARA